MEEEEGEIQIDGEVEGEEEILEIGEEAELFDVKDHKKKRKKVILRSIILSLLGIISLVVIITAVVAAIVCSVRKSQCLNTNTKAHDSKTVEVPLTGVEKIEFFTTADINIVEVKGLGKIIVEFSAFALSKSKLSEIMKNLHTRVNNETLHITAHEKFGNEGMFFGALCSGTNLRILLPPQFAKKISGESQYGQFQTNLTSIDELLIKAYHEVVVENLNVTKEISLTTVEGDLHFRDSRVSSTSYVHLQNTFGKIYVERVKTNPSQHQWANVTIITKYGDVIYVNVQRSDLFVHSTFSGFIHVTYHNTNFGYETIPFLLTCDELGLKNMVVTCSNDPSSMYQISYVDKKKFGRVRFINGTVHKKAVPPSWEEVESIWKSKQSETHFPLGDEIFHHIELRATYSGAVLSIEQ